MRRIVLIAVLTAAVLPAHADEPFPDLGDYDPSGPVYDDFEVQSQYVKMRDGVRLAVDVLLPKGRPTDARLPALLYQTSFWRSVEVRWPFNHFHEPDALQRFFVRHGYAVVLVDVRGTGASFGSRLYPWHEDELEDGAEIVQWIVAQPWSDGTVGAFGAGYEGTAAELLATRNRPEVKAVMPMFSEYDTYLETAFPGGIFNEWFVRHWSKFTDEMSRNIVPEEVGRLARAFAKGVSPVEGVKGRELLEAAIAEHRENVDLYELALGATARDTVRTQKGHSGSIDDFTVFRHEPAIEASGTPVFAWGSWFNGASADSVIRRFRNYENPVWGIIGPWNKGATQNASPYARSDAAMPPEDDQRREALRFFDRYLRGRDTGHRPPRLLLYFTLGVEQWRATTQWPPAGAQAESWYFASEGRLAPHPPAEAEGADAYKVDFDASTGDANRWRSHLLGAPVRYPDRAEADRRLLTYDSPPLESDIEITGHPVVTLYVTSTHRDGAFYVYLEEIAPSGRVTYLTEGQLRALYRKVSTEEPPYVAAGPYHSFTEADAAPLIPGETAELAFALQPISAVVRKGHRLRVAVAGHDASVFARVPEEGAPTVTVARNAAHASRIELPVIPPRR